MHPAAALRRTLTVTIIPVTFASGAAAPGRHCPDTAPTLPRHCPDTAPTLPRHCSTLRHSDTAGLNTHPARRPSHAGNPRRAPRPGVLRGVGWLPPRHDGARPCMRTTCATSVLGVCRVGLGTSYSASPHVGSALSSFTWGQCSAVSTKNSRHLGLTGCATYYHTLEQSHRASAHAARACREGAGRPHGL